ncbi:hypothetical protein F1737_03350 [Methanoplanus sp. FWC-SCC4]|uniref:Uncharacterized protein n=1 Tax=Methanochimaera problematica TaxID=2609417 RepID=A0AA97I3Z9_9EURY|nr:hypothetical protein [Methanoplanus sp. FWC-SCC4]WOF15796.1 hypothetical protein F1737_03350 [Methanoplanus sp. FWC-SCC4]
MKKRQNIDLLSFGADDVKNVEPSKLAQWAKKQIGVSCDLLSYQMECLARVQKGFADKPCSGGLFYKKRVLESIAGIKSGFLNSEPYPECELMKEDAKRVSRISKGISVAMPPPSGLMIEDSYFNNRGDFIGALSEVYSKMMREQRDAGIKKHVLISDRFDSTELDDLPHNKIFYFSPEGSSSVMKSILSVQDNIAVYSKKIPVLFEILNEYDVKNVIVVDGNISDFDLCMNHFDPDNIFMGGYCCKCPGSYWKDLKENAFLMV